MRSPANKRFRPSAVEPFPAMDRPTSMACLSRNTNNTLLLLLFQRQWGHPVRHAAPDWLHREHHCSTKRTQTRVNLCMQTHKSVWSVQRSQAAGAQRGNNTQLHGAKSGEPSKATAGIKLLLTCGPRFTADVGAINHEPPRVSAETEEARHTARHRLATQLIFHFSTLMK